MRVTAAELLQIRALGRRAAISDPNPYQGDVVRATMWRAGYNEMIEDQFERSPARQAFLRASRGMSYFT